MNRVLGVPAIISRTYAEPSPRPSPTGRGSETSLPLGGTEGGILPFCVSPILSISRFVTLTPALSQRARESLVSPLPLGEGRG